MFLGRQTGAQVREATSFSMLEASEAALEVRVTWCGEPLRVDHLSPPRSYLLAADASADFRIDAELLPGGSVALPPVADAGSDAAADGAAPQANVAGGDEYGGDRAACTFCGVRLALRRPVAQLKVPFLGA